MASTSEVTIGAKVTNAEKISTNLKAFAGYAPSDTALTATELDKLINNTKAKNSEAALQPWIIPPQLTQGKSYFKKTAIH